MNDRGDPAGRLLRKMQSKIDEPIAAILTLNTIAHTMGATMGGAIALNIWGDKWMALFGAVLTFVILVFTEIIPKTVGAVFWKQLAAPAAYTLRVMVFIMKPILIPLSIFSRILTSGKHQPTVSRTELEVLAEIGRREGTLDEDEWQVVSNVIRLDEVTVAEVMTPPHRHDRRPRQRFDRGCENGDAGGGPPFAFPSTRATSTPSSESSRREICGRPIATVPPT